MSKPKQQHSLPRFLLKGFATRIEGRDVYTYLFRQDAIPPVPTNTKNFGASNRFYGAGGKGTLDDQISERETEFANLVDRLRSGPKAIGRHRDIAVLVGHLIIRTRHLREAIAAGLLVFSKQVGQVWSAPDKQELLQQAIVRHIERDPDHAKRFALLSRPARRRLVQEYADEMQRGMVAQITAALDTIDVKAAAATAHNRALSRHHQSTKRVDQLDTLEWAVVEAVNGPLVMGDLGPIGRFEQSHFEHPIQYARAPVELILPLSSSLALVGTPASASSLCSLDAETVNLEVVQLSREFFICSQRTSREERYATHLARRGELMNVTEICASIEQGFEEFCRES